MANLFLELLQVSLGTRDKLSRVPNAHEWGAIYDEAERQAIIGILLGGLERLPAEQLPPLELKLQWIGMGQMMEAEYRLHCERASELSRRFHSVGFKNCVLKGIAISRYYPQPERRQCGDIDLWVDGRRKDVMAWMRSQYEIGHNVWHNVGVEIFEDVSVEIHFHPAWLYHPMHNYRLQRFFDKHKKSFMEEEAANLGFSCTSTSFDAIFALVHFFRHLIVEGVGLRHVIDYYYVCKQIEKENIQEEVKDNIRRMGLIRIASAMMWVLNEKCGMPMRLCLCQPNEKEGLFLLQELMVGGNFGQSRTDGMGYNSFRRFCVMLRHYPNDVLWILPWKVWHKCWRLLNT